MSDLISRQAAIDKLKREEKIFYSPTGLRYLIGSIRDLPSAQSKQRWIPCSERLPENNTPVNITWVNRDPEPYYAKIKDVPFTATGVYFDGKWYWYSSTVEDYLAEYGRAEWDEIEEAQADCIDVIAWMPLPEPYKGEES